MKDGWLERFGPTVSRGACLPFFDDEGPKLKFPQPQTLKP